MFWSVLGITVGASLVDGINPIAIAQQFVLQSSAKNKHGILAYILGIGMTNFMFGVLFYFGLGDLLKELYTTLISRFPMALLIVSLAIGAIAIGDGLRAIWQIGKKSANEEEIETPQKQLTSYQLFIIGIGACLAEITSALPYLTYLTLLVSMDISWGLALMMLFLYSLVFFNLPLYLLYIISIAFESKLTKVYALFQRGMNFVLTYLLPVISVIVGVFVSYYAVSQLIN